MSDPNETNPVTPIHPVEEKSHPKHSSFKLPIRYYVAAIVGLFSVISWGVSYIWNASIENGNKISELKEKVKSLEDTTRSQWSALTEHENRIRQTELQCSVVMWLLEHGKIKEVEKVTDTPLRVPRLEFISPEDFKKLHEEKSKAASLQLQMQK